MTESTINAERTECRLLIVLLIGEVKGEKLLMSGTGLT